MGISQLTIADLVWIVVFFNLLTHAMVSLGAATARRVLGRRSDADKIRLLDDHIVNIYNLVGSIAGVRLANQGETVRFGYGHSYGWVSPESEQGSGPGIRVTEVDTDRNVVHVETPRVPSSGCSDSSPPSSSSQRSG